MNGERFDSYEADGKLNVQAWTIGMSSERRAGPIGPYAALLADEIFEPLGSSYECRKLRWVPGPSKGTWIALRPWLNLRWRSGSVMEGSAISGQAPPLGQRARRAPYRVSNATDSTAGRFLDFLIVDSLRGFGHCCVPQVLLAQIRTSVALPAGRLSPCVELLSSRLRRNFVCRRPSIQTNWGPEIDSCAGPRSSPPRRS